jgi:hypothetical protein
MFVRRKITFRTAYLASKHGLLHSTSQTVPKRIFSIHSKLDVVYILCVLYSTKSRLEFLLQVFKCASATCGFFYHPQCVTKLLHRVVDDVSPELARNIARGESFTCPAHYCCICKEMENKKEHELHFAVCRRCPKSYHRKCLPRLFYPFCPCF